MFAFASLITGKGLKKVGYQMEGVSETVTGCLVICGVLGCVAVVFGLMCMIRDGGFMPHVVPNCDSDSALAMFVIIGIIVLVGAAIYWSYYTIRKRIDRHRRSVGVKENVVVDYTRGIDV